MQFVVCQNETKMGSVSIQMCCRETPTPLVPTCGQCPNMGNLRKKHTNQVVAEERLVASRIWCSACVYTNREALANQESARNNGNVPRLICMNNRSVIALSLIFAAMCLGYPGVARAQVDTLSESATMDGSSVSIPGICAENAEYSTVKEALRLVCLREHFRTQNTMVKNAIVIGFVGGFARRDDTKHPEVQFAALLRQSYPSIVHAEVFANHDGKKALRRVLQLLDDNEDGVLTATEKEQAKIIIYGHSWGASQAVTLARELGGHGVPVLLTILVDSVHKPGHDDSTIPSNVRRAVNFYQTRGFIHGRSNIRAFDPERTSMLGNFRMAYRNDQINCDNYSWIARHLNKPHHEIENDPQVWGKIASLIDSELLNTASALQASLPSGSLH